MTTSKIRNGLSVADGTMTERIAELEALLAKATPCPWYVVDPMTLEDFSRIVAFDPVHGPPIAYFEEIWMVDEQKATGLGEKSKDNALLSVAAVNALPELLAEIKRCHEHMEDYRQYLEDRKKERDAPGYETRPQEGR